MPSGMTEENALKHVLKRAMEESSCEVEDGNEVEDGIIIYNSILKIF